MINPSFLELREIDDSRYRIVMMVSKRARDLVDGANPLIPTKGAKPVTLALEEIMEGKVVLDD